LFKGVVPVNHHLAISNLKVGGEGFSSGNNDPLDVQSEV